MWVGLIQSSEGISREKIDLLQGRGNSATQSYSDLDCNLNSSLGLQPSPTHPVDINLTNLYNFVSQFPIP